MTDKRKSLKFLDNKIPLFDPFFKYVYNSISLPDSVKDFLNRLFIRLAFFKSYDEFVKELVISQDKQNITDAERQELINNAIKSKNTLVALFGLGFGYIGVHLFQFWSTLNVFSVVAALEIAASFALIIPIGVYLWAARLQSRAIFLQNLAYEESKLKYKKEIEAVRNKIAFINASKAILLHKMIPARDALQLLIQEQIILLNAGFNKILDDVDLQFNIQHEKLISYYRMQTRLNPLKIFARTIMLFTVIFALEAADLMFSGFLIPSLFAATFFAMLDFKSKEMEHDLKLKLLHEQLIALRKFEIEQLNPQNKLLQKFNYTPTLPLPIKDQGYKYIDYVLAGFGLTSAYIAISFVTLFNFHESSLFQGNTIVDLGLGGLTYGDVLLFGSAGFIAILIAGWTIWETRKLYQFLETEEERLHQETARLKQEIAYLQNTYGITLSKTKSRVMTGSLSDHNPGAKKDLALSESIKKTMRVLIYLMIFLAADLAAFSPFVIVMMAVAVLVGIGDYAWRRNRMAIEDRISSAKATQLELLDDKKYLLHKCKSQYEEGAQGEYIAHSSSASPNPTYASANRSISANTQSHSTMMSAKPSPRPPSIEDKNYLCDNRIISAANSASTTPANDIPVIVTPIDDKETSTPTSASNSPTNEFEVASLSELKGYIPISRRPQRSNEEKEWFLNFTPNFKLVRATRQPTQPAANNESIDTNSTSTFSTSPTLSNLSQSSTLQRWNMVRGLSVDLTRSSRVQPNKHISKNIDGLDLVSSLSPREQSALKTS